jgi:hypothetical protein
VAASANVADEISERHWVQRRVMCCEEPNHSRHDVRQILRACLQQSGEPAFAIARFKQGSPEIAAASEQSGGRKGEGVD